MSLTREQIIKRLNSVDNLPSPPDVLLQLQEELQRSEPSFTKIGRVISADPALAARFLRMANSALYGFPETASIQQAMMRIGLQQTQQIALSTAVVSWLGPLAGAYARRLWLHSVAAAMATQVVALIASPPPSPEEVSMAYTAGLLHDLGVVVFLHLFPERWEELARLVEEQNSCSTVLETELWGIRHPEVGAIVARRWHLAPAIQQAVAFHHEPWSATPDMRRLVQMVHIANFVCNNQGLGRYGEGFPQSFDHGSWQALGLQVEQTPWILERMHDVARRSDAFTSLLIPDPTGQTTQAKGNSAKLSAPALVAAPAPTTETQSRPFVLIVDDEPEMGRMLTRWLERQKCEAAVSQTVAGAVREIASREPDVVLVDLTLPDADGRTLVSELARRPRRIPVIVMSGRDRIEDAVDVFRHRVVDYLRKPLNMTELDGALKRALGDALGDH